VSAVPLPYLRLMRRFLLRPIGNDEELAQATALADELASRSKKLSTAEEQYLSVLCDLIERYEDETVSIPDVGPGEMLRFLIEQRGVPQQTVAEETEIANSTLSALVNGSRKPTVKRIQSMAAYFGVEPAVFLAGNG
jgi:antitoxin component HigA of HigAB toxin-antitoxin module